MSSGSAERAVVDEPTNSAVGVVVTVPPRIRLRSMGIHAVTEAECVRYIVDAMNAGRGGWVATANLDHLRRYLADPDFAQLYADASLVVADGMPLVWASRLQGTPLPQRVAGSNLIWSLSEAAAARGRSVYLLGGAPQSAQLAAEVLCRRYPGLRVAGTDCPPPGFENDAVQMDRIVQLLERACPDIVYVAMGSPKQEQLIVRLRGRLPRAWWLGIGISFSFVAGQVRRAPQWMQAAGLEWLHRLSQEPGRLSRRYLVHGLPFGAVLLASSVVRRGLRYAGSARA